MPIFVTKGTGTLLKCPVIYIYIYMYYILTLKKKGPVHYLAWSGKVISVPNMMARESMEV